MLQLSSRDLKRLTHTSELLLAPLEYARLDDWRGAVNDAVRELVGADSAGFLLPVPDAVPMFSREHSPEALAPFPDLLPPPLSDGTPIWRRMLQLGAASIEQGYGADFPVYFRSAYYNEYAAPGGAADTIACAIALDGGSVGPLGSASLHLWRRRRGSRRFGEREVAMLSLLLPAFKAGVALRLRHAAHPDPRTAFGLTPAESRVARLLAEGRRNAEIADLLGISPHTAKRHTERVMQKLGVSARAQVGPRLTR